jgi:hypothetical protein
MSAQNGEPVSGETSQKRSTPQEPFHVHLHHHIPRYRPAQNKPDDNSTNQHPDQRLRATMAAVKLSFTWLGVRKTLAPEQCTTAARAFHADRELLSAR